MSSFTELGLPDAVVTALARNSITEPSPIQAKALPDALAGRNVLGRAQTGSGKTLAFGLPMLARLAGRNDRPAAKRPRALVLVPTRELAFQVVESLTPYASTLGLGFLPEVRDILGQTRSDGQRLMFSATLDREVQSLVRQFLPDHVEHSTEDGRASVTTMDHYVLLVDRGNKDKVLAEIGARNGRTIMFARTKLGCDGITERLRAVGIPAESLHGGKAQNQRTRVLERFKNGRTPVLVATDVAARGIHVDGIDLVVHVDPPADHKDYLHRAGRTARAGENGTVVAIVLPNQRNTMRRLTSQAGVNARPVSVAPGSTELATITGSQQPTGEPLPVDIRTERRFDSRPRTPRFDGSAPRHEGRPRREGSYSGERRPREAPHGDGGAPRRSSGGFRGRADYGSSPAR